MFQTCFVILLPFSTTEQTTGGIQGKPRAAPFIKEEDRTLREAYAKHIHVIKGKVKDGVTMDDKKGAWRQIVECVNAVRFMTFLYPLYELKVSL